MTLIKLGCRGKLNLKIYYSATMMQLPNSHLHIQRCRLPTLQLHRRVSLQRNPLLLRRQDRPSHPSSRHSCTPKARISFRYIVVHLICTHYRFNDLVQAQILGIGSILKNNFPSLASVIRLNAASPVGPTSFGIIRIPYVQFRTNQG